MQYTQKFFEVYEKSVKNINKEILNGISEGIVAFIIYHLISNKQIISLF